MKKQQGKWTKKSYKAIFDWLQKEKRPQIKAILLADGLRDVIERLEAAKNMGEWYRITSEAAEAVGEKIVEQSANQAEKELDRICPNNRREV